MHGGPNSPSLESRLRAALIQYIEPLVVGLLVAAFYHTYFTPGTVQPGGDAANLFWPLKIFMRQCFLSNTIPLWNPWSFMGAPMLASLQHGVFYPPNWIIFAVLPAHMGMNMSNVLHLVAAGVGVWWCLRRVVSTCAAASIIAGAAFPCTAWFWGHAEHINQIATVAWMPWMLGVVHLWLRNRLGWLPFVTRYSLLSAFQFLAGHPQEAFYTHLAAITLVIIQVFRAFLQSRLREETRIRVIPFFAAAMLAGLVAGAQLIPTMELERTTTQHLAPDATYPLRFSMPPDVLLTLFQPHYFGNVVEGYNRHSIAQDRTPAGYIFGEYGVYVGVPVLLLGIVACFDRKHRKLVLFLASASILCLLLAMGGNTDPRTIRWADYTEFPERGFSLFDLYISLVGPARGFRVPARILVLSSLSFCVLAGIGINLLVSLSSRHSLRVVTGLVLAMATGTALYIPSRLERFRFPADATKALPMMRSEDHLDGTLDNRFIRVPSGEAEKNSGTLERVSDDVALRASRYAPHANVPAGVAMFEGYDEALLPSLRFADMRSWAYGTIKSGHPGFFALLGIRYVFHDDPLINAAFYLPAARHVRGAGRVSENSMAQGAAYWRSQAKLIDFQMFDGPFETTGTPCYIPNGAVLDIRLPGWTDNPVPLLRTRVPSPNRIQVTCSEPPEPLEDVILAMGASTGWKFAQSGKPVEFLSPVHALLPAAEEDPSPATPNTLFELQYRPASYRIGLFLSAMGLGLLVLLRPSALTSRPRRP